MTRREFVSAAAAVSSSPALLVVPVHQVIDARAKHTPEQLHHFSSGIWTEAVRDFRRCGIQFQGTQGPGEIRRSPGGRPVFNGLRDGAINLILTGHLPMAWDKGRALPGLSTRHEGRPICIIALRYAHGHQIPFVSVNTCVHELLHVLLGDIFESRPKGLPGFGRELRIDWYATRLWLFHDGAAIREAARAYLDRLKPGLAART
ncbi:MAG: hypothetical protein KJZ78_03575 [Bryobacteraceae bacterium]|nr:hypothetical protein [Bryobacteraceae bacterium]